MYSLTQTGVHHFNQLEQNQPIIKMICKCNRSILQQQIYTCISCSKYCCHYCTIPQFSSYQCRNCKKLSESTLKNNKCNFCFSCPYCSNVLTMTKDKNKYWIYYCQFCYWSTKQINLKDQKIDKPDALQEQLFKICNLKQTQIKIYSSAQNFFKQFNLSIQMENQTQKYNSSKKNTIRSSLEQSHSKDKIQIKKINDNLEHLIKRVGLNQQSDQYVSNQNKYPQPLPLQTKKIRKCPQCAKPLTNIYKAVATNQLSTQLLHKDIKVLQCQRTPVKNNKVSIKFLKNCQIGQKKYKIGDVQSFLIDTTFNILAYIQNKKKNTNVEYTIKVQLCQKKK